jgi:acyl transferase domain-containing protein
MNNPDPDPPKEPYILPLSAATPEALEDATQDLYQHLKSHPDVDVAEVARTLQNKPHATAIRRILVCNTTSEAIAMLEKQEGVPRRIYTNKNSVQSTPPIVFMFPGQGAQYVHMGRDLYDREPVFRDHMDACIALVESCTTTDLKALLYPDPKNSAEMSELLNQTAVTQPALFSIEYALAQLWISRGIRPDAMIGHSIGEYTAACLAGVFSMEEALELVCHRARLMQGAPTGSMAAMQAPASEIVKLAEQSGTCIATINAPNTCVLSGTAAAIEKALTLADQQNILHQRLRTSHAFHSPMMDPAKDALQQYVQKCHPRPPTTPFISNLSGTWFSESNRTDPAYWGEHLRNAVRFSDGMTALMNHAPYIFLEVGPGNTLCTLTRQHMNKPSLIRTIASLRHPKEDTHDHAFFKTAQGRCWLAGIPIEWDLL